MQGVWIWQEVKCWYWRNPFLLKRRRRRRSLVEDKIKKRFSWKMSEEGNVGSMNRVVAFHLPASSIGMSSTDSSSSSDRCLLKLEQGDITKWSVNGVSDAIVNAANEQMLGGGGMDGAIHRAAGPQLYRECRSVPEVRPGVRCPTGEARITAAYGLPVSRVLHTVGPIYEIDEHPEASLRSAYRSCLRLAKENNIEYIAFPAISCGIYQYPLQDAAEVALSTVKEFSLEFKEIHFVLFSDDVYTVWLEKAKSIL